MNRTILATAITILAGASAASVFAQGPATPARPPVSPQTAASVPVSKMAVIYSEAFQDPKLGIARFNATLNKFNGEFQKVQDDLTQTAQRLRLTQDEINKS